MWTQWSLTHLTIGTRKLDSGTQTPEYIKFQDNYDTLSRTLRNHVAPNVLANKLFSAHLIGEDLKQQVNNNYMDEAVRIDKLLAAVHDKIRSNCKVFQKFVKILEDYDHLELNQIMKL